MEERGGVLVQNEKHANKSVAKVMRITFLIFPIVFLLNLDSRINMTRLVPQLRVLHKSQPA